MGEVEGQEDYVPEEILWGKRAGVSEQRTIRRDRN